MISVFDIGGSKVAGSAYVAGSGVSPIETEPTPTQDYFEFCRLLARMTAAGASGVGLSIAGVVDPKAGTVRAANIPCLSGKLLASDLEAVTGKPVFLINDAKAFALAEAHSEDNAQHDIVLGIILGTGIGGALVINGRCFQGEQGIAGEWGHGPASAARTGFALPDWSCGCGQTGCLDVFGGARGLERLHTHLSSHRQSSFEILKAWEQGDLDAGTTLDVYLDIVGGALANLVNIFDPSIIVAGGGLSGNSRLLNALEQELRLRCLAGGNAPGIRPASTGSIAALLGAGIHASQMVADNQKSMVRHGET
ncbi:ROK family protein [Roseibium denhamense]|uniref:N-acetylglucosamine kinase n=1 Tax=Roseibium denhamense TaxID=76305 RepID=A0ABY1NGP0_9HYPH|nr:ROK family protein [Roseibium denhamense]MTI06445.1 ROK family protein [Roseibium denhamense]SMP09214.1 N-acetylglucosamine kinase [Roseibium denhamense]